MGLLLVQNCGMTIDLKTTKIEQVPEGVRITHANGASIVVPVAKLEQWALRCLRAAMTLP